MQFHKEFYHKVPVLLTHIKSTSIIFDPNLNFDMLHCLCHKRFKVVLVVKFLGIFDRSCVVNFKVEKILKGSLYLIPSPSPLVEIQIMDGKVCLKCKGKTLLGIVNKLFVFKSLLTTPSKVLPLHLKQTFPPII